MDISIVVKVVILEESLPQGIKVDVISIYTVKFSMDWKDIYGRIVTIKYNPNRNSYVCLIHYGDGEKIYILYPKCAIIGDSIVSGIEVPIKMENALPLSAFRIFLNKN